jgi:hypothetical protein
MEWERLREEEKEKREEKRLEQRSNERIMQLCALRWIFCALLGEALFSNVSINAPS